MRILAMALRNVSGRKVKFLWLTIFFLGILTFWPASFSTLAAERYGCVYGIVVDEKGVGVSDVTVQVYTSGGVLVAITSTRSDGSFIISWVEYGTYSISFIKPGYAKAVKSLMVQLSNNDLGKIILRRSLKLSASTLSIVASQGDKINVPFTLENIGEEDEIVEFLKVKPEGWSVRVLDQGYEVTRERISPGESLRLQLEITVPMTAFENISYNVSLNAIGTTTNSSLTFNILICAKPAIVVSGKVIDESNKGIGEVKIHAYSNDGAYIKSASTAPDGSFIIDLPTSTAISLYFSKEGYTEATRSFSSKAEKIDLGEIILLKAVRLYSSVLSIVAIPGDKLLLPFVVSNIGDESEIIEFFMSNPAGWSARVLDQAGREIGKVEISSKASLNFQLEATIPSTTSVGDYNLTLKTVGKTNSTINFIVKVQSLSDSVLFCQFPGKSSSPGDTVQFQVKLKNPLGVESRFKISLNSIPPNWTASVKSVGGEHVTEVTLSEKGSIDLLVEVKSPDTAKAGIEYGISIHVESDDGSIVGSLPLNIVLNEIKRDVKITAKFPEVTVEAGKLVQYPITIMNLGGTDVFLLLFAEPPAEWKTSFKSGTLEVTRLYLEAGKSENLVIEATPPSTVEIGTYKILVQVKSEDGSIYAATELKATIIGSYALKLEPSTLLTSVVAGSSVTLTAKITNVGNTMVTSATLNIDAPQGWESSITPIRIERLEPRESFTFNLVVKVPEDTVAGDYLLTLQGLSDQVKSDSVQVRITVTVPTSWGLIGIGISVAVVIVLILVFMKFKRR